MSYSSFLNEVNSKDGGELKEGLKGVNSAKESFQNKIRKKTATFALLRGSFIEKELIRKYKDQAVDINLLKKRN